MSVEAGFDRCLAFINCQLQPPIGVARAPDIPAMMRAVTLSRQSGCGAHVMAEKLSDYLQRHSCAGAPRWAIFDRNLVEQVLAEHDLPQRLARFMPEDRVSQIDDIMDELFGVRPPLWTLVQQTAETILHLVHLESAIIVGRGANIITARMPGVLHIRLIASLESRIEHMRHFDGLDRKQAMARIGREDRGRRRYLKTHFHRDVDDPLLYHLVINTDLVSLDDAARIVGDLVLGRARLGT